MSFLQRHKVQIESHSKKLEVRTSAYKSEDRICCLRTEGIFQLHVHYYFNSILKIASLIHSIYFMLRGLPYLPYLNQQLYISFGYPPSLPLTLLFLHSCHSVNIKYIFICFACCRIPPSICNLWRWGIFLFYLLLYLWHTESPTVQVFNKYFLIAGGEG